MRGTLHVEQGYEKLMSFVDARHPFESVCEFFGFQMDDRPGRRSKVVRSVLLNSDGEDVPVYFKLYGYGTLRRSVSRVLKKSRSAGEFRNLQFFRELGIPACEPLMQGEYRNGLGLLKNCLIVTREIVGTESLDRFIPVFQAGADSDEVKRGIRRQIIESLAANLRKIHERRFYHEDLKWRNVLVRRVGEEGAEVEVFWIDCPNGYFDRTGGLRRKHGVVKDIATLDHLAWRNCTDEERRYFLSCYLGVPEESEELRRFGDAVVAYRKRRLDD